MKNFKDRITLTKNGRGCYIIDTVKGCKYNCYGDCYAKNIANRYKINFIKPVKRSFYKDTRQLFLFGFYDTKHENKIIRDIEKIDMPFVRIGEMGDPSESWEHTIDVCKIISKAKKKIVIITKHWNELSENLLNEIKRLDITINTSVSALDNVHERDYRIFQYHRLKNYCNSVLRIVSCDFNKSNCEGRAKSEIQKELFKNENVIDTVFRPSKQNLLVLNGVIKVKKVKFLKQNVLASVYNKNTYFSGCKNCPEKCGITA